MKSIAAEVEDNHSVNRRSMSCSLRREAIRGCPAPLPAEASETGSFEE